MSDDLVIFRARRAVASIAFNPPRYATDLLLSIADGAAEAALNIEHAPDCHPHGRTLAAALRRLEREARSYAPVLKETPDGRA